MAFNKAKALQEGEKLVSQGKSAQAIKQYFLILENEPGDLALLNTIGDLYVREKNVPEALKQFARLADAFVQEGFTVKAIAIYKKISKLDTNTVDPVLKLAELYTVQGLGREAREQYALAVDFFKKKNQSDKALEVFKKIIQLDPENTAFRTKLAEFCEQAGKKAEAAQAYLESAEVALRRGDAALADPALKKAAALDPSNPRVHLFRARLALSKQQHTEAEKIITSVPNLKADPAARELLLEAYLGSHKLGEAEKLVVEVFRANPADLTPLASFSTQCMEKGDFDAALKPLAEVADGLIEQKNTAPLMEVLRQIWSKSPRHIPTLELIHRISERTADEFTLPEVLEALAHAYVQSEELDKAEAVYQKLIKREPENEQYKGMLKQVLQKVGKEYAPPGPAAFSGADIAMTPEGEAAPDGASAVAGADAEQEAVVKEVLDNSDLFARYGLVDKAVGELEKVLALYPDQIDIHKRIHEICGRNQPARAAQAAQALARIFAGRGDVASARRYEQMGRQPGASVPVTEEFVAPPPPPSPSATPAGGEFDFSADNPVAAELAVEMPERTPPSAPPEVPIDLTAAPVASSEPAPPAAAEYDLSGDFAAIAPPAESAPVARQAPALNYEEARVEIDFYLEQGFAEEAEKAVKALEGKFPGNPQVAELRQHVQKAASAAAKAPEPPPAKGVPEVVAAQPAAKEWDLPESFTPPTPPKPPAEPAVRASPPPAAGADLLGSLAGDLASSLEGIEGAAPPPPASAKRTEPSKPAGTSTGAAAPLSGLLEELGEPADAQAKQDDPETHYNLGVAFREMGLHDEAIGEFQKVVKGAQKGNYPAHFLQACTLLALCFMDKTMPAIAVKWYTRALETPDLDEEATLALQYDLGVAYEQAGETRTALEKFTEVYSQNIDYRDVAEKIRLLQQKA